MTGAELEAALEAARHCADVARTVIRPFFRAGLGADAKDDRSPVTVADRAAERAMRAVLGERLPRHGILGEEFGLERPEAACRWVLDPIDGTRAFLTGRPTFGVLVALLEEGVPVLGIIDQPVTGERWIGARGRPTTFEGPGFEGPGFEGPVPGRARCRPCPALAEAELSCTDPAMMEGATAQGFAALRGAARRVSWGGDCYAYGLLALGGIDVIAERTMKTWDWAALVPVVEGAGGRITDWRGHPLRPDGDGTVLALGDPALAAEAQALLALGSDEGGSGGG